MKRNYIRICILLSIIALATSCVDEIQDIDVSSVKSKDIIFGSVITDDIIVTRSGEGSPQRVAESKVTSESGDVSLPVIVEVEKGIKGAYSSGPTTRASITRDVNTITQLDAWAIYTKYTDVNHSDFEDRYLYFDENKVNGAALSFSKNETDGIFYSEGKIYPWPGDATAMFNFVTVTPVNSGFQARLNALNNIVSFDYTVPADPAQHKDILVASPEMIETDFRQPVPLTFKHVMAAVNVKVGEVPNGKITSLKFTGVYNKASYYPDGDGWVNRTIADGGEFSVDLPDGGVTVGTQSNGTTLTTGEAGFMMIPQQLYTGAELQVTFLPDGRTEPVVLRASIQGDIWEMNTTTNYWISINPDYMISIVPLDKVLDSHYIITKVEVSSDLPIWSVEATANDGAEVTVQLEQEVNPVAKMGFWTDKYASKASNGNYYVTQNAESARGKYNCGGNTAVEGQVIYVFIPENVTGETRTVTLTMLGGATDGSTAIKTLELTQEPVKWMRDPNDPESFWGCEILLEGGQVPWGFAWNEYMEVDLRQGGTSKPEGGNIASGRVKAFKQAMSLTGVNADSLLFNPNSYVQIHEAANHNGNQGAQWFICIDLSKLGNITIAPSIINGYQNTYDIYHWDGISFLNSILNFLVNWDGLVESNSDNDLTAESVGLFQNTLDYAAMYAMKRNRFHLYEESIDGSIMQIPVIEEKDLNWYLPAKDQFPYFMNLDWGQSFSFNDIFWTSTAYNKTSDLDPNSAHAYAYLYGMETISHRKDSYLTFALRRYLESSDVEVGDDDIIIEGGGDNGPEYGEGGEGGGNTGGDVLAPTNP